VLPFTRPRQAAAASRQISLWLGMLQQLPNTFLQITRQWADVQLIRRSTLTPLDFLPIREVLYTQKLPNLPELRYALECAIELAAEPRMPLAGRTYLALDTSGSMSGTPLRSGALLAASLAHENRAAELAVFDTQPRGFVASRGNTLEATARQLEDQVRMSPTNFAAVVQSFPKNADRLVLITDMPYCLEEISARKAWRAYQQRQQADGKAVPPLWIVDVTSRGKSEPLPGVTLWSGVSQELADKMALPE
jgi:hypothetical protein